MSLVTLLVERMPQAKEVLMTPQDTEKLLRELAAYYGNGTAVRKADDLQINLLPNMLAFLPKSRLANNPIGPSPLLAGEGVYTGQSGDLLNETVDNRERLVAWYNRLKHGIIV